LQHFFGKIPESSFLSWSPAPSKGWQQGAAALEEAKYMINNPQYHWVYSYDWDNVK